MTFIDSSKQIDPELPAFDIEIRCSDHPHRWPKTAYGLAGGGIGEYTYCDCCGKILSKTQDSGEDW